jgi:hypothetical protein
VFAFLSYSDCTYLSCIVTCLDRYITYSVIGNLHYLQITQSGPVVDYERAKKIENYVNFY